nr:protease Do-like 7 isoform X2 [Tanacetum cinerariifolium]
VVLRGSPVHRYGLYALQGIMEVNGKPTHDLDAFVKVTKVVNILTSLRELVDLIKIVDIVFHSVPIGS